MSPLSDNPLLHFFILNFSLGILHILAWKLKYYLNHSISSVKYRLLLTEKIWILTHSQVFTWINLLRLVHKEFQHLKQWKRWFDLKIKMILYEWHFVSSQEKQLHTENMLLIFWKLSKPNNQIITASRRITLTHE